MISISFTFALFIWLLNNFYFQSIANFTFEDEFSFLVESVQQLRVESPLVYSFMYSKEDSLYRYNIHPLFFLGLSKSPYT